VGFIRHSNDLNPSHVQDNPEALSVDKCLAFFDALSTVEERLIAHLMLQSDIRRGEALSFPVDYVLDPKGRDPRKHLPIALHPGDMELKGHKGRTIYVSRALMATRS
jgi:hypothetical protein